MADANAADLPPVSPKHCGKRNPCCMRMQLGITIMAIVDAVLALVKLILIIVTLLLLFKTIDEKGSDSNEVEGCGFFVSVSGLGTNLTKIIFGVVFAILMIGAAIEIIFALILLLAARKMNRRIAGIWLVVAIIFLIIGFGGFQTCDDGWPLFVWTILSFLYRIYMLVCVWFFIEGIKREEMGLVPGGGGPGAGRAAGSGGSTI